jgi:hypothetical protein
MNSETLNSYVANDLSFCILKKKATIVIFQNRVTKHNVCVQAFPSGSCSLHSMLVTDLSTIHITYFLTQLFLFRPTGTFLLRLILLFEALCTLSIKKMKNPVLCLAFWCIFKCILKFLLDWTFVLHFWNVLRRLSALCLAHCQRGFSA